MSSFIYLAEIISLVLALGTIFWYKSSHSNLRTVLFFVPLVILGYFLEGLAIKMELFSYVGFNWIIGSVPVAVILYWFGGYYLYLLYKWGGTSIINFVKIITGHFLIESFIFTPIAITIGYWKFANTLFETYPYIPLTTNVVEVCVGLLFVLLQFKIDKIYKQKNIT